MPQRFLSLDDLTNMPKPTWLIEGLFEDDSLVMLAGPSYSFKSFLLLDWLMCMASGRKWMGRKTAHCNVAYILGEGKSSLMKRVQAWIKYNELTPDEIKSLSTNFRVSFEVPQMASKPSVDNMLADLEKEGFKPDVIAVDTFARAMVGKDENDAMDTGVWIDQADRLRQLGFGVIFLHHTKKNTEFGVQYRGSSAIMGAMDTAMTLVRSDRTCTLTITKQKDHDEGAPLTFTRVIVPLGGGEESCVLVGAPLLDSRFAPGFADGDIDLGDLELDDMIEGIILDPTFSTDLARATELNKQTGRSVNALQVRISRRRRELERTT